MVLEVGENDSTNGVPVNWEIPNEWDASTQAVLNIKCEEEGFEYNEDHDFEYDAQKVGLEDVSGGLPDDIGQIWLYTDNVDDQTQIYISADGVAQHKYTFTLLSFEHNGQLLYP